MNTSKKNNTPYLDAWAKENPGMNDFILGSNKNLSGGATTVPLPEGASREEQDIAHAYQSAYNNALAIDKRAQNAVLKANKAHDLSMKYLAAQNEANGLGGLGIADTSSLRLSSQYQKALTDAYATREASLLENYQKMSDDVSTIRGEWASREEAKKDEKYNMALNNMANITNEESLSAYLNAVFGDDNATKAELTNLWGSYYKDGITANTLLNETNIDTVTNKLIASGYTDNGTTLNARGEAMLNDWKNAMGWTQEKQDAADAVKKQYEVITDSEFKIKKETDFGTDEHDNFTIIGPRDKEYSMETGAEETDENILNAALPLGDKEIFKSNGQLYIKSGGKVYKIKARSSETGGDYEKLYSDFNRQKLTEQQVKDRVGLMKKSYEVLSNPFEWRRNNK